MRSLPSAFKISPAVGQALRRGAPLVALESTVITHGLPYPQNLKLAREMEQAVNAAGASPATIGVLDGRVHIGLSDADLERLATAEGLLKISARDFGAAIALHSSGGTTVAGTILAAHQAGLQVMATGGIGGVHRYPPYDVSADLQELARTPMVVVCSGAKAVLDLPATLEMLETLSVPVLGYQTDELPAFYSANSGIPLTVQADNAAEVAGIARAHWSLSIESAVLVAAPPPAASALPMASVQDAIEQALAEAEGQGLRGQAVTPFLLERVSALSGGASLDANLALLKNNARIAGEIAVALARPLQGQA